MQGVLLPAVVGASPRCACKFSVPHFSSFGVSKQIVLVKRFRGCDVSGFDKKPQTYPFRLSTMLLILNLHQHQHQLHPLRTVLSPLAMLHPALPVAPRPRASLLVPSSAPSPVSLGSPNPAPNSVAFDPDCPVFLTATHHSHQLSACRLQRTCSEIGEALFCIYLLSTCIFVHLPMRFVLFSAKLLTQCA